MLALQALAVSAARSDIHSVFAGYVPSVVIRAHRIDQIKGWF
jgi:hypothetical protein